MSSDKDFERNRNSATSEKTADANSKNAALDKNAAADRKSATLDKTAGANRKDATSDKKAQSNRTNSLLSTGPKTTRGKSKSCSNATTTGIHSESLTVPGENVAEGQQLLFRLQQELKPQGELEQMYVYLIARDMQRLRRAHRAENAHFDKLVYKEARNSELIAKGAVKSVNNGTQVFEEDIEDALMKYVCDDSKFPILENVCRRFTLNIDRYLVALRSLQKVRRGSEGPKKV